MPRAEHFPPLASAGIAVIVAWRVVVRVRRLVGHPPLRRMRAWLAVCAFPLLLIGLGLSAVNHPWGALAEAPGVAIGIALSLLLLGGLPWRAAQSTLHSDAITPQPTDFVRSPLTMLVVGTTAGCCASCALGLLRWRARVQSMPSPTPIESA